MEDRFSLRSSSFAPTRRSDAGRKGQKIRRGEDYGGF